MTQESRAPATLSDVAAHAGVSLATASRVLNGSTRRVRAPLHEKVVASARVLGYVVDAQAQAVARGTSSTIALVVGDIADPYFSGVAAGAIAAARSRGMTVTISTVSAEPEDEVEVVAALRSQRPRAVILARSRHVDPRSETGLAAELDAYRARGGSVSFVDGSSASDARSVRVANQEGAAALASALVERGYRRFGVLAGDERLVTPRDRVAGFVAGAERAGVPIAPDLVVPGGFSRDGGRDSARELLARHPDLDCVFAVTDVMAVGAMAALRELGLEPGADVGVAGFDDIAMLADVRPSLTTVALPLAAIGERAVELALAADDELGATRDAVLGDLRLRESTPAR
ncbi:LacI family transcriptional regulator [Cnuibacter physcomitrellae]|uniref:LacI family DNA-binding transcriptional regulator n=1 Tax=Cnuibacter physcomitrellae TaxID=1619308 RepID=UPI002175E5C0|nr:LacI family DNA-binding transcriptional regulator [Cnuibacter physcomitrellae]MCS5497276.1 LacI family transcriptional regulator [Cnuibacter physcomitrellae]